MPTLQFGVFIYVYPLSTRSKKVNLRIIYLCFSAGVVK
jgi:hypothetical protein